MDAEFCFLKEIGDMGSNEDGAQKPIILTISGKLTVWRLTTYIWVVPHS